MFRGVYHEKTKHLPDLEQVLARAEAAGVAAQIVTAGSLSEVDEAAAISGRNLFCTAGCHPTRAVELESYPGGAAAYVEALAERVAAHKHKVVAIGECGLDYDRLHFAPAEAQKRAFDAQLELAERLRLPLFLHSRAAHSDLVSILAPRLAALRRALAAEEPADEHSPGSVGVVHSFTGTKEEAEELVRLGLFIGINGCSLKTEENLQVVRSIPLTRIMLETAVLAAAREANPDIPPGPDRVKPEKWRADALVKGRNEPSAIVDVALVVAQLKGVSLAELAEHAFNNTQRLFALDLYNN
ncbi:hypothetical protein MCUN1_001335 [Malassezia cuniculi]|uniref:Uncharacterized protein n=1 Tax=Malassezia cuniculi TaxID=948313 RepID=A0AAF0ESV5_9BASI|nr:hypothetical protein MCUN1_001335 [Malassezia cuniculi]